MVLFFLVFVSIKCCDTELLMWFCCRWVFCFSFLFPRCVFQWWLCVQCVCRRRWREFYSCTAEPWELHHYDQNEAAQSQDGGHEPQQEGRNLWDQRKSMTFCHLSDIFFQAEAWYRVCGSEYINLGSIICVCLVRTEFFVLRCNALWVFAA